MRIFDTALIVVLTVGAVSLSAHQVPPAPQQPAAPPAAQTPPTGTPPVGTVPLGTVPAPVGTPAPGTVLAPLPTAALPVERVFAADAGLIFNPIRADKVIDFEMVLGRLHDALARSTDPMRRRQASAWKVFKATEPGPSASVLYVFAMDPVVPGADYTVSKILADAFPMEVRDLYRIYTATFAGAPSLVNLKLLNNLGAPFTPKPISGQKPAPGLPSPVPGAPAPVPGLPSPVPGRQ